MLSYQPSGWYGIMTNRCALIIYGRRNYPKNWDSSVGNSKKLTWLIISLCTHSVPETHSVSFQIKYDRLFAW